MFSAASLLCSSPSRCAGCCEQLEVSLPAEFPWEAINFVICWSAWGRLNLCGMFFELLGKGFGVVCPQLALGSAEELPVEKQPRSTAAPSLRAGPPPPLLGAGHSSWEGFLTDSEERGKRACEGKELDLGKAGGSFVTPLNRREAAPVRVCAGVPPEEGGCLHLCGWSEGSPCLLQEEPLGGENLLPEEHPSFLLLLPPAKGWISKCLGKRIAAPEQLSPHGAALLGTTQAL